MSGFSVLYVVLFDGKNIMIIIFVLTQGNGFERGKEEWSSGIGGLRLS